MAFQIFTPLVGAQDFSQVAATAQHPLGLIVQGADLVLGAGEFIYLQGVASTAVGDAVVYNADDYSTTRLVANAIGPVAVAMAAVGAGQFGWYQIGGKALVNSTTVVDNANVYATATPGVVDDTVVAGDRVKGAKFASADGSGKAEVEIHRPFMDDGVAA